MSTATDTRTWIITGEPTCDVRRCYRDAAIIADTDPHPRFCSDHTLDAAGIALTDPAFTGWYRIIAATPRNGTLTVTVHPL